VRQAHREAGKATIVRVARLIVNKGVVCQREGAARKLGTSIEAIDHLALIPTHIARKAPHLRHDLRIQSGGLL